MKVCPVCGLHCEDDARFCPRDGTVLDGVRSDPWLGKVLMGQFEVLDLFGEGATGAVYKARQRTMDRLVAIKFLRPEYARETEVVKRFRREAKAAARLAHPNIITVHLVGETDDGIPYLVMEFVEGTDLSDVLSKEAPLKRERAFRIAAQIADALAEAHAHGIVHRDLKPANIKLCAKRDQSDFVKVLDFGIAKILQDEQSQETRLTKTGTVFGTPYYLSPEQASGDEVDHRSDIYSLGVILYQMVTGHLPFSSKSGIEVLVQHIKNPVPAPSQFVPDLAGEVEALILRALAKKPKVNLSTS